MSEKKIIAIVGATGAQGGSLARAILGSPAPGFSVRALTRNAGSDKARALASAGAEVVEANLDEPGSVLRAFAGAYGAFCITNFWEHFSPEKEGAQAETMARAAAESGLRHVIWSTLEDTRRWVPISDDRMPTLMGKYKVPHFDGKGEADRWFEELRVPTTYLLTSFYWENLIHFGMGPKPGPDGKLAFTLPMDDKKLPGIAVEDIGRCALGILGRTDLIGKRVGIAGEHPTGQQMAASLSRALARPVAYQAVPPDVYRGFGFPGAEDLGNMFQFKRDFQEAFCGARELAFARSLNPALQSFDRWLEGNASRIPTE